MRRKARTGGGRQVETRIERLAGQGDGLASLEGRPLFVPLAAPGDLVRLRVTGERGGAFRGELLELLEEGPDRIDPPCPHFGPCGGCALQHISPEAYRGWKAGLVSEALSKRGFETPPVRPMVSLPAGTRRRAVLAAKRQGRQLLLGFHERRGHRIVDQETCLLLTEGLRDLIAPLRELLRELLAEGAEAGVTLLESESGADVLLTDVELFGLEAQERMAAFAEAQDLARISWAPPGEAPIPAAERRVPLITFGEVAVAPAPGGFLQPSRQGQEALTGLVLEAAPEKMERAVDLFCGCGTFTFPLAGRAKVFAIEGDAAALAALWRAARTQELAGPVRIMERDLNRQPLSPEELEGSDFLVFDPPRAGAKGQAEQIAESDVPIVAAVSCNPTTFARDAAILRDGGYSLDWVVPVDQFIWTGHLELVARFSRPGAI